MIYICKVISRINNAMFKVMLKIKYGRKIKIGKKEYNVVKKVEQLSIPDNFTPFQAEIYSKKVPALYNEITGYILVGLKDEKGNIKLYVYDPNTKSYSLYNEITFNSIKLYYTNPKNPPKGLKKVNISNIP